MITNLPTQESLNKVALRTYFRAWNDLIGIWSDFSMHFGIVHIKSAVAMWSDEWSEYLLEAQSDLQAICSLLQQSMELALKARICAVSPYLLLLDTGMKLSASPKQIDFSELRTLDAVDLPGAVNTLTDSPISDDFIGKYTTLRSLRNKIMHLGEASVSLAPEAVLRQAVSLYLSMWPDRNWLSDRLNFAAQTRQGWLHDGKYTSTHMDILHEWPIDVEFFTKGEFKKLFGHDKSKRRYLCHYCVDEGDTRYAGLDKPGCGTAYLDPAGKAVSCIMCGATVAVVRKKCTDCEGNVVGDNDDDWTGRCHTCGVDIGEDVEPLS
ncbi:hypothetical protein AB9F43_26215 [Rhizobium leguminosarum]|uniref:hypothetical protein n=1 Tax=Rhizobium leguminosarum TaxID=384 RepID=UPI003F97CB57